MISWLPPTISGFRKWLSSVFQLNMVEDEDISSLHKLHRDDGTSLSKTSQIKQFKKGLRYPDWPKNRAICYGEDQCTTWINKENHL